MPQPTRQGNEAPTASHILPPHTVLRDFLAADEVEELLEYAVANESTFAPTGVGRAKQAAFKPQIRVSLGTRELGPFEPVLTDKLRASLPELTARLRTETVDDPKFELQLVAHGDGAFYRRHIDTRTGGGRDLIRVLSGVYYFHARPKAFTGGALRLYALGDPDWRAFADIAPDHNSLLVFPSWAPHEVMSVSCPSKRFADSRFAINCWIRRPRLAPGA